MDEGAESGEMLPPVSHKGGGETTKQRCIRGLSDIRFYTASLTMTMFSFGLAWGYFLASITTIEKRFGFGSTEAGLILGCYEMGHLSIALFISHFGNRVHIPRIMFVSFLTLGICSTVLALPHFFLGPLNVGVDSVSNNVSDFDNAGELCIPSPSVLPDPLMTGNPCADTTSTTTSGPSNYALPAIIFMIMGVAGTPMSCLAMAYIDNNAAPTHSPLYVGICFSALSLGPTAGFFLGAWCLSKFEDLTDPPISPDHPRWIGAWWLGLLVAGSLQVATSVPMLLVGKRKKPEKSLTSGATHGKKPGGETYTCKGLLAAAGRILKNPVFISLTLTGTCGIYIVAGFFSFLPKYFETQYGVPAWKANSIAGLVSGFAAGIGSIVGGGIVMKFKLRFRSTLLMCMTSVLVAIAAMLAGMFMGCDNVKIVTSNSSLNDGTVPSCVRSCQCSDTEYYPVCDVTSGVSYFSPCLAGCDSHWVSESSTDQLFTGCSCIAGGNATAGLCPRECTVLVPYSIIFVVFTFAQSLITSPGVILTMRCVKKSDKALAMGIAGCIASLLGWVVAPVVFGVAIDSACALWQRSCGSAETGSCWLYHNNDYRLKFHGITLIFTFGLLVFFSLAFKFSNGKNFDENDDETPAENSQATNRIDGRSKTSCDDTTHEMIPLRRIDNNNISGT